MNATIGVLFGMETTFPPALVEKINGMKIPGVTAEFVSIGGIRMDEPQRYRVIVIAFRTTSRFTARSSKTPC